MVWFLVYFVSNNQVNVVQKNK
uniref:Uncharacterized protein n=1 Tax=Tetranychus urticae TaxID=32264 RepID=T1L2J0_TETUR